jgi:hypothetical protein
MKTKTNISTKNNRGIRIASNMIVGEVAKIYNSGDILDANAIVELVKKMIHDETILFDSITTQDIKDNTIAIDDLSEEVMDKIGKPDTITSNDIDNIVS